MGTRVNWIEEEAGTLGRVSWLSQTETPNNGNGRLTAIEIATITGVVIGGVSLLVNLWHLAKKGEL